MDSCNERVMIDSYGYEAIMNDNNSKIINICVVGGKSQSLNNELTPLSIITMSKLSCIS